MSKKSSGMSEGDGEDVKRPADAEDAEADAGHERDHEAAAKPADQADSDDDDEDDEDRAAAKPADKAEPDEDDEDDEDDPATSKQAHPAKPPVDDVPRSRGKGATIDAGRPSNKRRRAGKAERSPGPLSEAEIDSPSKQTLGMLGVVAAATLVMWGVGRAECNYNEVGEGMKPRELSLEERTRTPKDVAFAFEYALGGYDFPTARKLATGDAKKVVEQREQACKGGACDTKRESVKGKLGAASELLKRTASHALARVWSEGGGSSQKYLAVLKRDGRNWLVESYSPDNGRVVELPGEMQNAEGTPILPSPTSSAVPPLGASSAMPPSGHPPVPGHTIQPPASPQTPASLHAPTSPHAPAHGAVKPPVGIVKPPSAPGAGTPPPPAAP